MGLIQTPATLHIKWNRKSRSFPWGYKSGGTSQCWISRISTPVNFQLKFPLWFKMGPKFFRPPQCVLSGSCCISSLGLSWPFCPADFSGIFAGFLIHVADRREAEYFKAIWILQDDKLFLLSNICIITTKIIFEMATRQYNFSPSQGLKSQEKMNRACFNQEISSFSSHYK